MDLERLIAEKRLEIEKEKTILGLSSPDSPVMDRENQNSNENSQKQVRAASKAVCVYNAPKSKDTKETHCHNTRENLEEIPADLERYIRRYLGLPVMLKAGEYSPNNPLLRDARAPGDALLGLGEYERRRHTLRRIRQQQYKEYLDQQSQKKQEAKELAERERREREQRERELEERERAREDREQEQREREKREREKRERERRLSEQERRSPPERRRASVNFASSYSYSNKVDAAVQVDSVASPLSVAVQTDDVEQYRLPSPKWQLTQAERELSPHTVVDRDDRPSQHWSAHGWAERRKSVGDRIERSPPFERCQRDKPSESRHAYMPSILDADAIQQRNAQAEKEAATRRQFYQQELKNQIMEQQRIREDRKTREKMLEQAEMRRLEEQLSLLRQVKREHCHDAIVRQGQMKKDAIDYEKKRAELQMEIDSEQQKLRLPTTHLPKRTETSRSEDTKLPFYYPRIHDNKPATNQERKPFSTNIPDDSIFSQNYDVDSYLRRNLNFKDRLDQYDSAALHVNKNQHLERVLVHERPKTRTIEPKKPIPESIDTLPIPVLRHSPLTQSSKVDNPMSDAMRKVDDKWKVPIVQKNILKSVSSDEGKNVSILTQLGSIRRQLQLEQLKLDQMAKSEG